MKNKLLFNDKYLLIISRIYLFPLFIFGLLLRLFDKIYTFIKFKIRLIRGK